MASTTSVVPSIHQEKPAPVRSSSRASTASAGVASLRRRSRTRTRVPTISVQGKSVGTSGNGQHGVEDRVDTLSISDKDLPPLPAFLQHEPESLDGLPRSGAHPQPERSSRRPRTAGSERRPNVVILQPAKSDGEGETRSPPGRLRQARSEGESFRGMRQRAASLPRHAFRTNVSSDSSSQPSPSTPADPFHQMPEVQISGGGRSNFRDSVLTQISATSSSLYPASTVSGTRTESSLPYTLDSDLGGRIRQFSPEIMSSEKLDFDADDVSYRLRLLVNNSYFLPPAHAKPSPLSLAPPDVQAGKKMASKASNNTFLDFFRIGKSKSKPATPLASPPALDHAAGPILRTTSDSTTASGFLARPPARSLPITSIHTIPPPSSTSRVVVVRERMDDLVAAAQEAEKDLRSRATVHNTRSRSTSRVKDFHLDVIDPTDAVDLPPPPPGSFTFGAQASAVYGLGIRDSIGAAILAEQLPPESPGIWSSSTEDDSWRKALLQQAVSHSLTHSTDISYATTSTDRSAFPSPTPVSPNTSSPAPSGPSETSHAPHFKLGRPILEDLKISTAEEEPHNPTTPTQLIQPPLTGNSLSTFSSRSTLEPHRSAWHVPGSPPRAESPAVPHPLAPPPRKRLVNPLYSLSQPDLSDPGPRERDLAEASSRPSLQALRKVVSSPILSDAQDANANAAADRHTHSLSPPPMSISQRLSVGSSATAQDLRATPSFSSYQSLMSQSILSDDDELFYATPADTDVDEPDHPRPSVTVSLLSDSRPSLSMSEYSNPSPTASAFHDAIFGSYRPPSVLSRRSYVPEASGNLANPSTVRSATAVPSRASALSPPPRVSSSLNTTVLPPPPRMPAAKPVHRPSMSSRASTDRGRPSTANTVQSFEADPSIAVPPLPTRLADRRGLSSRLSLRIPSEFVPSSVHSAPAPASPTEFFDRIGAAMDELEDSDESDEDETTEQPASMVEEGHARADTPDTLGGSPRPSFMRMGNHSSPQLAPSSSSDNASTPVDMSERNRPISNTPAKPRRGSYFSSRKKGLVNTDIPLLPFAELAASHEKASGSRGPGSQSRPSSKRRPATANDAENKPRRSDRESLQKFDGMLLQHLEAERSRIKQITSNMSSGPRS